MEDITLRYGESLVLPIDTADSSATSATMYIGKPGESYILTKTTSLTDGVGAFEFSSDDTKIPLDEYSYQINVTDAAGFVEKYPEPDEECYECESDFPRFVVREALDLTEVS